MKTTTQSSKPSKSKFENPYRVGSCYHAIVAALVAMGANKLHKYDAFAARVRKDWKGYKEWASKAMRNRKTGKTAEGRLLQNVRVLQRTVDFGRPLILANAVIDLAYNSNGVLTIGLNTHSRRPQKPGRAPKPSKPQPKPAKSKPKSTRKPSGGKKGAQKRSVKAGEANLTATAAEETAKAGATDDAAKV